MNDLVKKIGRHMILQSIISIVLGVLLIAWPQITTMTLIYLMGAYAAIAGLFDLINYYRNRHLTNFVDGDLIGGIFLLIIALIIFVFPRAVASVFTIIIGIMVLLSGIVNMVRALEAKKYDEKGWIAVFLLNIVVTSGGILIIINPFSSAVTLVLILGILTLTKGIVDLVSFFMLKNALEKAPK